MSGPACPINLVYWIYLHLSCHDSRCPVMHTKGIPLAFPNSVDATDNHVYVADMVNLRLLRLKKIFEAIALSE